MAIDLGKHLRPVMRRAALAALLLGAALPAAAETLGDTMVAAYRHSALLDQQRAVLRATDDHRIGVPPEKQYALGGGHLAEDALFYREIKPGIVRVRDKQA